MIGRLPLGVRLTLVFAGVMALVLAATGAFLYLRLASELDATIDARLRAKTAGVAALAQGNEEDASERG